MNKLFYIGVLLVALSVVSCRKTPSWVIPQNDMEELLVDIHIADALIQEDYRTYNTSEKKEALYEAVLKKHGVTKQELDTSLYWYGRNAEMYIKMYEKVNKKLEDKAKEIAKSEAVFPSFTPQTGDTVNIWNDKSYRTLTSLFPADHYLYKEFVTDTAFYAKDIYKFTMKISGFPEADSSAVSSLSKVVFGLGYSKDSLVVTEKEILKNGLFTFEVETDSLVPEKIYNYIWFETDPAEMKIFVDSISLWRIHQKQLSPIDVAENDSVK